LLHQVLLRLLRLLECSWNLVSGRKLLFKQKINIQKKLLLIALKDYSLLMKFSNFNQKIRILRSWWKLSVLRFLLLLNKFILIWLGYTINYLILKQRHGLMRLGKKFLKRSLILIIHLSLKGYFYRNKLAIT
jgi:hypothetical protein